MKGPLVFDQRNKNISNKTYFIFPLLSYHETKLSDTI